jgi:hypothetical protein
MSDLLRFGGEPKVDVFTPARRPWRRPLVIESTLSETQKMIFSNEFGTRRSTAIGPS